MIREASSINQSRGMRSRLVAAVAAVVLGAVYLGAYHLSIDVRELAKDAMEPLMISTAPIVRSAQCSILAFLFGAVQAYAPFGVVQRGVDLGTRVLWSLVLAMATLISAQIIAGVLYP